MNENPDKQVIKNVDEQMAIEDDSKNKEKDQTKMAMYRMRVKKNLEKTRALIVWKEKSSLLPTFRIPVCVLFCLIFIVLIILNLVILTLGIIFVGVLPGYNVSNFIPSPPNPPPGLVTRPPTSTPFPPRNKPKEDDDSGMMFLVPIYNKIVPLLVFIGIRLLLMASFTILFIILGIIAINYRLRIIFFIFILGIFIISVLYFDIGVKLFDIIENIVRKVLTILLFNDFDKDLCTICHMTNGGNNKRMLFEQVLLVLLNVFDCCGIDSPADYYPLYDNKIPVPCCNTGKPQPRTDPPSCMLEHAVRGCIVPLMEKAREFSQIINYVRLVFIIVGLTLFIVFVISVLETVSFYLKVC